MARLLWFIGASVGGAVGWWLGEYLGVVTAGFLSLVGTALGIYWARRIVTDYL